MYPKYMKAKWPVVGLAQMIILILVAPQTVRGDDAATLVGGWRATEEVPDGIRITDTVLQANGTFSQTMSQGPYMLYVSGTYKAAGGTLQFKTTDWSPRVDAQGSPIRVSPAWVVSYRIVDQNHIQSFDSSGKSVMSVRIR